MNKYPKVQTVYLRDPATKYRTLLKEFATPEFEYLANNEWVFTEKVDGMNLRVCWDGKRITFGGRTERAQIPAFLVNKLQEMFPPGKFLGLYPDTSMTLYGEGYGARIQKGGGNYIPDDVSFILFDVMINDNWLERENVEDIASCLAIDAVPIVGRGCLAYAVDMARNGFQSRIGTQVAEGLVMRPVVELCNRRKQRIITKIKHKDFPQKKTV